MTKVEEALIKRAKETHGDIYPIPHIGTFEKSFTYHQGMAIFWFNTEGNTTRALTDKMLGSNHKRRAHRINGVLHRRNS